MLRRELQELVEKDPFEPFELRLVNGDIHQVNYPQNIVVAKQVVTITPPDQNWVIFPIDKIAAIESIFADFQSHAGGGE